MSEGVRQVASVAAAIGVAGLLLPLPWLRRERQRAAAAALLLGAWGFLAAGLVKGHSVRSLGDRLASPAGAVGALVALAVVIAVGWALVRAILRRPTLWFVLLGVALPIRVPISLGSQQANLLLPLYGVILLGLVAWAVARRSGRVPAPAPDLPRALSLPLAAFTAYVLVSVVWSADPVQGAIRAVFFYIPFVLLLLLTVAWWPYARALAALAVTVVAGGVIAALVGLLQFATKHIWWNQTLTQANVYSQFFRVNGIFYDPNILGRYLAMGILTCLALAWVRRRGAELAALGAAVAIMTAGLAVTFSRSSALMLMLGILLLAARAVGPWRSALTALVLLVVIGGVATAVSGNVRHALTNQHRLERVSEGRFQLMKGGLQIWRDDPVTGVGLGGFKRRFEATLTPTQQKRVRVVVSHNSPITVLSEEGVVGFALFIALLVGAGWAAVRGSREQGEIGWARWTLGAIIAGIALHSLLYAALFEDPFLWVALAGAVALGSAAEPAAAEPQPAPSPGEEAQTTAVL